MPKYFISILLLLMSLSSRSQHIIDKIEFGICNVDKISYKMNFFQVYKMSLQANDSSVTLNDGKDNKLKILTKFINLRTENSHTDSYIFIDSSQRKGIISFNINSFSAENRVIIAFPCFIIIYHLLLSIV
jgi:hypothetical protein